MPAPFMGLPIGWALTTERPGYFIIRCFVSGAGYAKPLFGRYLSAFLQRILPRPGKWMEVLKIVCLADAGRPAGWAAVGFVGRYPDAGRSAMAARYQPQKVEQALQNGDKVLTQFPPPNGCITCLVNENAVFSTREFARLVKEHRIKLFVADWTSRSPEIARALARIRTQQHSVICNTITATAVMFCRRS